MRLFFWNLGISRNVKPDPKWFVPWSAEITELQKRCQDLEQNLGTVSRQTEATRKKVYRDSSEETGIQIRQPVIEELPPANRSIRAGDPL